MARTSQGICTVISRNHKDTTSDAWYHKRAQVELFVDLEALAQRLGKRAMFAKTGRATSFGGIVVCKRVGPVERIDEEKRG